MQHTAQIVQHTSHCRCFRFCIRGARSFRVNCPSKYMSITHHHVTGTRAWTFGFRLIALHSQALPLLPLSPSFPVDYNREMQIDVTREFKYVRFNQMRHMWLYNTKTVFCCVLEDILPKSSVLHWSRQIFVFRQRVVLLEVCTISHETPILCRCQYLQNC